jgi:hypothetical protein
MKPPRCPRCVVILALAIAAWAAIIASVLGRWRRS